MAEVDTDETQHRAYFSELLAGLVAVMEAVGRDDLVTAGRALLDPLDRTAVVYPNVPTALGFGVQAAGMVAYLAGRPTDAITLLSGSRSHQVHYGFEGAARRNAAMWTSARSSLRLALDRPTR